jgi:hypothetical protein
MISTVLTVALAAVPAPELQDPPRFAAPVRLTADGDPLGEKILYPSPRLFDIDRDGRAELVVGDLRGQILVAERTGDELAAFGPLEPFVTDGRPLKFHNW